MVYVFGKGAVTDWQDPSTTFASLFLNYGLQNKDRIRALAGNFDYNGDGYSDFLFGSWDSGNEAGNNCGGSNRVVTRLWRDVPSTWRLGKPKCFVPQSSFSLGTMAQDSHGAFFGRSGRC